MANSAPATTTHLMLYTGPGGPISVEIEARDVGHALTQAGCYSDRWFDGAENALDLPPDANETQVDRRLDRRGWTLAHSTGQTDGWSVYVQVD